MSQKQHVALDLDGTLLSYSGWTTEYQFGDPVKNALWFVKELLARGHKVSILTARTNFPPIHEKLKTWGFPSLEITNIKQKYFTLMIDDNAWRFSGPDMFNTTTLDAIDHWHPWWKMEDK